VPGLVVFFVSHLEKEDEEEDGGHAEEEGDETAARGPTITATRRPTTTATRGPTTARRERSTTAETGTRGTGQAQRAAVRVLENDAAKVASLLSQATVFFSSVRAQVRDGREGTWGPS
jgi:hypothetical protein